MSHLDLIGIGYPSIDKIMKLSSSPNFGETAIVINDNSQDPFFGGCAVNITYLLSHFNYRCGLVMTVGNDFESSGFKQFLLDKDISLDYVKMNHQLKTSYTSLLEEPNGDHITLFYPGPMSKEYYEPYNIQNIESSYGLVTIGELTGNKDFLNVCISKNIPIIFSMKGDFSCLEKDYLIKIFENSELIFMNKAEYDQLNNYLPSPVLTYFNSGKLNAIVVTDGSNGSTIYLEKEEVKIPIVNDIDIKDTAGGGDAYIAGFLKDYFVETPNYYRCGVSGSVLSSFIIEEYGCLSNIPSLIDFEKRRKLLLESRGESV
ncbi:MAG: PfkB family carbohydrate kinase [Vagococcus sp.]